MKYTNFKLQTLQDEDTTLLSEKKFIGGIGSVLRNRYVISDENKKISYIDVKNLYSWTMFQSLRYNVFILKIYIK